MYRVARSMHLAKKSLGTKKVSVCRLTMCCWRDCCSTASFEMLLGHCNSTINTCFSRLVTRPIVRPYPRCTTSLARSVFPAEFMRSESQSKVLHCSVLATATKPTCRQGQLTSLPNWLSTLASAVSRVTSQDTIPHIPILVFRVVCVARWRPTRTGPTSYRRQRLSRLLRYHDFSSSDSLVSATAVNSRYFPTWCA